jgi:type IV pilus assembly protein PilV
MDGMNSKRVQQGSGLIEVLVALLLLSIGVMGFIGLQVRASSTGNEAFAKTQAMAIAQDLAERVRLNIKQVAVYTTANNWRTDGDISVCEKNRCTPAQVALYDMDNAVNSAATLLPNGQVRMRQCPNSVANCVIVSWDDTNPTVGAGDQDCITPAGLYRNNATCVMMEAY